MTAGKRITEAELRKRANRCIRKLKARKADCNAPAPTFEELQAYLVLRGREGKKA